MLQAHAIRFLALGAVAVGLLLAAPVQAQTRTGSPTAAAARPGLTPFRSDEELAAFIRERARGAMPYGGGCSGEDDACLEEIIVTGTRIVSITNTQEAGVDEGGIVKAKGDLLVVLRRGRLFTVSIAGGGIRPITSIAAYPPGVDASDDWYDEMLVAGDRVVVIGYSYGRGGTEINRFRLGQDGALTFEDAYHLRSSDYYSSRNYASRLIGDQLVLYTPLSLSDRDDPLGGLPRLRRWTGDVNAPFRTIAGGRDIYVSPRLRDSGAPVESLHSVIRCDLTAPVLNCHATGVLGPDSRTFYVSSEAVYLWTSEEDWPGRDSDDWSPESSLYRIPLDGTRPQGIRTRGAPLDQFSFREDAEAGVLNVLVLHNSYGDEMWRAEFAEGAAALLRLPLSAFGDGSRPARARDYRMLPQMPKDSIDLHNRFVGDHLIYAGAQYNSRTHDEDGVLIAARLSGGQPQVFDLAEPIDRIEVLGDDALVVGGDDAVAFTTIELSRGPARLGSRYVFPNAEEAEDRSHAFFFHPDNASGTSGVLGLPVMRDVENADSLFSEAADIVFLRRRNRGLSPLGTLASAPQRVVDDGCVASCIDWYGDARPIFIDDRIFALLGYELVEGRVGEGGIAEIGRAGFAPPPVQEPAR